MLTAVLILLTLAVVLVLALGVLPRMQQRSSDRLLEHFEQQSAAREREFELRMRELQSAATKQQTDALANLAETQLKQQAKLGEQQMQARQEAIDKQLEGIGKELKAVQEHVTKSDKAQNESMTKIAAAVKHSTETTRLLQQDTQKLSEVLAGSQSRGQWGERIAEDVLRVAGFIEGINYVKQQTLAEGGRPDYTFLLPDSRRLNMDVKMPMAAFARYLDAGDEGAREQAAKEFLRDAKERIKEVTSRSYINPAEGTLDYTLVFIPNEQIYGFIHERDASIVDYALANHVVICSPLTLFAVLSVIRQSADNFRLETRTREIQAAIGVFRKQWEMYKDEVTKVGRAIDSTNKHWNELSGKRERQLDKAILKVDELRQGGEAELSAPDVEPDVASLLPAEED